MRAVVRNSITRARSRSAPTRSSRRERPRAAGSTRGSPSTKNAVDAGAVEGRREGRRVGGRGRAGGRRSPWARALGGGLLDEPRDLDGFQRFAGGREDLDGRVEGRLAAPAGRASLEELRPGFARASEVGSRAGGSSGPGDGEPRSRRTPAGRAVGAKASGPGSGTTANGWFLRRACQEVGGGRCRVVEAASTTAPIAGSAALPRPGVDRGPVEEPRLLEPASKPDAVRASEAQALGIGRARAPASRRSSGRSDSRQVLQGTQHRGAEARGPDRFLQVVRRLGGRCRFGGRGQHEREVHVLWGTGSGPARRARASATRQASSWSSGKLMARWPVSREEPWASQIAEEVRGDDDRDREERALASELRIRASISRTRSRISARTPATRSDLRCPFAMRAIRPVGGERWQAQKRCRGVRAGA